MSYEFIIGTVIGLAGIGLTWICSKEQIKSYVKPNMQNLFSQLAATNISSKKQKSILKKISRKMFASGMGKLSSKYIETFSPKSNTKSAILLDMCVANKIEPTSDVCKAFLGYNSPALLKDYIQAINHIDEKPIDKQTNILTPKPHAMSFPNTVYVSSLLKEKFPQEANELFSILAKHKIAVKELSHTKDIWCRDYMPVQTKSGKLIQFKYEPSYLKGNKEWEESKCDVREVCEANGFTPIYSDIILDGGNVLQCDGRVIVTDRIFAENKDNPPYSNKETLIKKLEELLEAEVIVIPALRSQYEDFTGHADGYVRFVNRDTILGNKILDKDYQYFKDGMKKACDTYGLQYIEVPIFEYTDKAHPDNAIGIYVNYLEVGNLIVLPIFGVEGEKDQEAVETFKRIFPDRIIETINYNKVALEGGLLNCSTWTINE